MLLAALAESGDLIKGLACSDNSVDTTPPGISDEGYVSFSEEYEFASCCRICSAAPFETSTVFEASSGTRGGGDRDIL